MGEFSYMGVVIQRVGLNLYLLWMVDDIFVRPSCTRFEAVQLSIGFLKGFVKMRM